MAVYFVTERCLPALQCSPWLTGTALGPQWQSVPRKTDSQLPPLRLKNALWLKEEGKYTKA